MRGLAFTLTLAVFLPLAGGCSEDTTTPDHCKKDSSCSGESCLGDPWTSGGQFGDPCFDGGECQSGMCGQDTETGTKYCTETCDPNAAEPCPRMAACLLTGTGTSYVCGPPADGC
jgi:hypothetical protein